jgi:hypothetical protein
LLKQLDFEQRHLAILLTVPVLIYTTLIINRVYKYLNIDWVLQVGSQV